MSSSLRQYTLPRPYVLARDRGPLDGAVCVRPTTPRRRGRPPLMVPEQVLEQIRSVAAAGGLFRVHIDQPAMYARARRLWGSWAGALLAAGLDYESTLAEARRRALETRRRQLDEQSRSAC